MAASAHMSDVTAKGRGRPAGTTNLSDVLPLFVELRRVTGCTPRRLRESFGRIFLALKFLQQMRPGRIRDECDLPSYGRLQAAFAEAGLQEAEGPPTGLSDRRPGWFALHVARAILGDGEPCELAIFWEPFSRVVFAQLARTLNPNTNDVLSKFVDKCLSSLPPPLRRHLSTVLLTSPVSSAADPDFWYCVKPALLGDKNLSDTPRREGIKRALNGRTHIEIVGARNSTGYAAVDFRPFTRDLTLAAAGRCLREWQNAYNLCGQENYNVVILGPGAGEFDPNDLTADRRFFEGDNMRAPPEKRLEWALRHEPGCSLSVLREMLHRQ